MLIGCINCYNDMPLIVECVQSIYDKVDKLICIDGKYRDFPGDSFDSEDGTLEYLQGLPKVEVITTYGFSELNKRNRYLEELIDGDIVLNLDADEVLIGEIPPLNSDFGIVDLHDGHSKHVQKRATRFFKFKDGLKYENVHYTLYLNGVMLNKLHEVIKGSFEYIKDFHLVHNWHLREDLRKYNKSIYYKKLVKMESGFAR